METACLGNPIATNQFNINMLPLPQAHPIQLAARKKPVNHLTALIQLLAAKQVLYKSAELEKIREAWIQKKKNELKFLWTHKFQNAKWYLDF